MGVAYAAPVPATGKWVGPAPEGVLFGSYGRWLRRRGLLRVSAGQVFHRKSVPVRLLHGTGCRLPDRHLLLWPAVEMAGAGLRGTATA